MLFWALFDRLKYSKRARAELAHPRLRACLAHRSIAKRARAELVHPRLRACLAHWSIVKRARAELGHPPSSSLLSSLEYSKAGAVCLDDAFLFELAYLDGETASVDAQVVGELLAVEGYDEGGAPLAHSFK